jgi:hypothetical protein
MTLIFLNICLGNILVKAPYYEKGKEGRKNEYPPFFPTQEITP